MNFKLEAIRISYKIKSEMWTVSKNMKDIKDSITNEF